MMSPPSIRPYDAPRLLRSPGDRRGWELLEAPPAHRQRCRAFMPVPLDELAKRHPLVVSVAGGVGDAVRTAAVCSMLRGRGLPWSVYSSHPTLGSLVPNPPGGLPTTRGHDRVIRAGGQEAAVLPPVQAVYGKGDGPSYPLLATLAGMFRAELSELCGPCLPSPAWPVLSADLQTGGWDGRRPLVAIQSGARGKIPNRTDLISEALELLDSHRARRQGTTPAAVNASAQLRAIKLLKHSEAERLSGLVWEMGGYPVLCGQSGGQPPAVGGDLRGGPLSELLALCYGASLVVAGCSAPLHIAGAYGTPALGLYGPTDPLVHVCSLSTVVLQQPAGCPGKMPCGEGSPLGFPLPAQPAFPCADHRVPFGCSEWTAPQIAPVIASMLRAIARSGEHAPMITAQPDPNRRRALRKAARRGKRLQINPILPLELLKA